MTENFYHLFDQLKKIIDPWSKLYFGILLLELATCFIQITKYRI